MRVLNRHLLAASIVLLNSLIFCQLSTAQLNWRKFSYFRNFGGLNDNLSSTEIDDSEATDIQNIIFDVGGAIKKRSGYLTLPNNPVDQATSGSITGLAHFKKANGNQYIVLTSNIGSNLNVAYKASGSSLSYNNGWTNITNISISGYNSDYFTDFAVAEDNLVMTGNGSPQSPPLKWTGTGSTSLLTSDSDCPASTICEYHKRHLFLSGNSTNPSRVWFSNLDDITAYTATDFFDIETNDGSIVRGMISAFDALYIFKDYSIWRLSGYERDSFFLEKMVNVGTSSNNSIQLIGSLIYFVSPQNDIIAYDGGYNFTYISQKITNTINDTPFSRAPYALGLAFSTYKHNDNDYYCHIPNSNASTSEPVLMFDTAYKAWTKFIGIDPSAWCVSTNTSNKNIMVFGDIYGYVYTYPSTVYYDGNVNSSAINAFYQTKWFKYSDVSLGDKYWRLLKTYALTETTATNLTAECKADMEESGKEFTIDIGPSSSASLWDVALWDVATWAGQVITVDRQEVEKGTNMFQLKYSNSTVDKGFTIVGFETYLEQTDRI